MGGGDGDGGGNDDDDGDDECGGEHIRCVKVKVSMTKLGQFKPLLQVKLKVKTNWYVGGLR